MVYVALLRGINVGGNCAVSMKDLKESFEKLGYKNIKTYINSGNVIFQATNKTERQLEEEIEKTLEKNYPFKIRVLVRNCNDIKKLVASIPVTWKTPKEWRYNVIFLSPIINTKDIVKNFLPKPDIEELHFYPGALFWSAKSRDLTHSTMIKVNKSPLYKELTVRNLNTVKKIYELMSSQE